MANVSYRFHFNMFHCLTRCTTSTTINNRTRQADHVDVEIESVTLNNLMIRGAFGDPAVESLKKFVVFGELYPRLPILLGEGIVLKRFGEHPSHMTHEHVQR